MIIVTGASKGLGQSIAERLVSLGKAVIGVSRSGNNELFETFPCDVSDYGATKQLASYLKEKKQPIEAVVNAAGMAAMNLAITTPPQQVNQLIAVNLVGTINVCQNLAPLMIRNKKGRFLNFSTIAVPLALKGESIYVASKAGVEGFSRSFANEMAPYGVTVNCIAPGPINTDLLKGVSSKQIKDITDRQLIKKQFEKSDICDVVEVLLDERSKSLTGQVMHVGGVS